MYLDAHSNTIHNGNNLGSSTEEETVSLHTRERPSARKRREALTFATMWTDPKDTMLRREADTEGHTGCDSTDGKRPEQAD